MATFSEIGKGLMSLFEVFLCFKLNNYGSRFGNGIAWVIGLLYL